MRDPDNPVARRAAELARQLDGRWHCEAYGPEPAEAAALCFVAEPGARRCPSAGTCGQVMAAVRQHVFDRITELAQAGDPTGVYLAEQFTSPGQLLGGGGGPFCDATPDGAAWPVCALLPHDAGEHESADYHWADGGPAVLKEQQ